MKLRIGFAIVMAAALVTAGCGSSSDSKDSKKSSSKKDTKQTPAQEQVAAKSDALAAAKKAFDKKSTDVDLCRDLAMKYIAVASPESTGDPKVAPKQPKDRTKNLKNASKTLEGCTKIDGKNRDVQQMLASTYMALNQYDKAAPMLKALAGSAKGAERPNAYYAWGLAAGNAMDYADAIKAWQTFVDLSPRKDPRVAQVKQSIAALKVAQKQPAPKAAATNTDTKSSDTKSGDNKSGDTKSGDTKSGN